VLTDFIRTCGCHKIDQIAQPILKKFAMKMKRQGLGDRTISNRLVNVVTFLKAHGIDNISLGHRHTEKKVSAYSNEELTNLFAACDADDKLLFQFFLGTGFREQEVSFAHFEDWILRPRRLWLGRSQSSDSSRRHVMRLQFCAAANGFHS
jgi:integrase